MSVVLETSVGALKASYFHAVKKIESLSDKDLKLKKDLIELRKLIRSN